MGGGFQGAQADDLSALPIGSFDGGLNTVTNPLRLKSNESPFLQNVSLTETGRLLGRDGSTTLAGAPGQNDAIISFWNSAGNRCQVTWSNGDIYDTTNGAYNLLTAAVYTSSPTTLIGKFVLKGILYWSDGIIYRYYDPTTATEAAVIQTTGAGLLNTIGFTCAIVYTGFPVVGNTTANGTYEPDNYRWPDLLDPTSWPAVNAQAVGENFGGHVSALTGLGVADAGVAPYSAILALKSIEGCFLYTGALGQQTEAIIPVPGGILDPETLQLIERSGRGADDGTVRTYATWLSNDRQLWWADGINSGRYSDNIRNVLQDAIVTALTANPDQRFTSVNATLARQYLLDMGNGQQYVFQYDLGVWTFYQGLPSGFWAAGYDSNGLPAVYCAARTLTTLVQVLIPGQALDDTNIIQMYYFSPFLHMNSEDVWKRIHWLYLTFVTDVGQVESAVISGFGQDTPGATYNFVPDSTVPNLFVLDESLLDGPDVLAGINQNSNLRTFEQYVQTMVPIPAGHYDDPDIQEMCQGKNFQVQLAQTQKSGHFEILSYQLDYEPRGRKSGALPE
jgi:hypothetical protein